MYRLFYASQLWLRKDERELKINCYKEPSRFKKAFLMSGPNSFF